MRAPGATRDLLHRLIGCWLERGDRRRRFEDAPMADGCVEVVAVDGLAGETIADDPRFRRFAPPLPPQPPMSKARRSPSRTEPSLLGRVAIGSIFLGQDGRGWSNSEQVEALASVVRAAEWIERQAVTWQARVNLQVMDLVFEGLDRSRRPETEIEVFDEGDGQGFFERHAEIRLVASLGRALEPLGCHDLGEFINRVVPWIPADSIVWVVHVRAAGRSFVIPEREVQIRGVALAVCYAREQEFPGKMLGRVHPDAATIAHEVLHLFGASDKYGVPLSSFPANSVTRDEVMRLDHDRLPRLRVDPLTASELGWPERKPPASTR